MRLLFAISVASFCAVLWLALSLARRIRRDRLAPHNPAPQPPAMEFFEAGEFRTPRALRLNQQIAPLSARRHPEELAAVRAEPPTRVRQATQVQATQVQAEHRLTPQTPAVNAAPLPEAVIIDSRLQFVMAQPARPEEPLPHDTSLLNLPSERKSPQSARSGTFRRVDLSHYNKDLGDLTDPYTHSPKGSGVRPSVAKNA